MNTIKEQVNKRVKKYTKNQKERGLNLLKVWVYSSSSTINELRVLLKPLNEADLIKLIHFIKSELY